MKEYSRICAQIDLSAIEHNLEQMHEKIHPNTKMIAVIKADGYGHGAAKIASVIENKEYLWGFAVATPEEGFSLRKHGIEKPIILLGFAFPEHYQEMIQKEIRICVFKKETALLADQYAKELGTTAKIHLAVDTGMSRIGFQTNEESLKTIEEISKMDNIQMEGIFTHFAKADEKTTEPIQKPLQDFMKFIDELKNRNISILYHHCSNSAALIRYPDANMDLVRAGISLYGLYPSDEMEQDTILLKPAMSLVSKISYIKEAAPGTEVSYGGTFTADKPMRIATIPVGYADGYPRQLSNKGYVLIKGKKAPILGRICMDQFMADVTNIPEACEYDIVTLAGTDGNETISIEALGRESGRFHYEFICNITKRVPRNYYYKGELIGQTDYFDA